MNPKLKLALSSTTLVASISILLSYNILAPPAVPGSYHLHNAKTIRLDSAFGPESLAFDANGDGPYSGVADGRILKWQGDAVGWTDFAFTSSHRQFLPSIFTTDKTGRLLKYNKSSKEVTVLLRGLAFANGVALSKDSSFVLVAETTTCRILRLWLRGPNAGNVEVFSELPGFPDNIRRNKKGEFWVALHAKKGLVAKLALSYSLFGNTVLKLPLSFKQLHSLFIGGKPHAIAVKLSENGEILEVLEDTEGKTMRFISEVEEKDGKLWIGSKLEV
ncbi:hypothetical protein SCA6_002171 [Theobroma cacao]